MTKNKLLIAIPCGTPYVPLDFMMSVLAMDKPITHTFDLTMGIVIDHARNRLVESAIEKKCTHILFLDSDMTFPKDLIPKLLGYDKDIIGGLYVNRHNSTAVVFRNGEGEMYNSLIDKDFKGLIEVDGIGAGALLIKINVLKKLPKPWFRFAIHKPTGRVMGEDLMFCKFAKDKGYKIHCDTNCKCGHLVLQNLTAGEGE